ncbi:MAG: cyclic nucleotide-binding domain-containing protein [Actinobacteria bacterium]|nr:cyclic nucleotide-binding domain-containing protein [Actinomycetota bacterium]
MQELPEEVEALRKVPFFEGLTPEDLDRIARIGERRTFRAGEAIFEKGDEGTELYVIMAGQARVEVGGREHGLGPGAFFGEMALVSDARRSATVTAAEPTEAMVIKSIYFKPFLIKNPSVAVAVLEGVVNRLREVQERIDAWMGS